MASFGHQVKKLKQGVRWLFWSCDAVGTSASITHIGGNVNGTILFARSRWLKQDTTKHFLSYYARILMASPTAQLHLLVHDDQMRCDMTFSVIWHCWHWHQHHVMLMALSISPLYSLGQGNWNNVQYNSFGHVMPLMPLSVSHDVNSVINGTIPIVMSWWS